MCFSSHLYSVVEEADLHSFLRWLLFLHPQGKMSPSISVENIVDKSIRLPVVQENIKKSMSIS